MDSIPFEIDLAGLGIGPERQRLLSDAMSRAIVGNLPGGMGHVIASEWRGERLVFEYRPHEDAIHSLLRAGCSECGDALDLDAVGNAYDAAICRVCAGGEAEDAKHEGHLDGEIEAFHETIEIIEEMAKEAKDSAGLALNRLKGIIEERRKTIERSR